MCLQHTLTETDCMSAALIIAELLSLCARTEQWKKLCVGEPGGTGLPASGIRNSHKTTPCVATY